MVTNLEQQRTADPPAQDEDTRWGRQVDMAGTEYFSVVIDQVDAKETADGGIRELMGLPAPILAEVIFREMEEELWFQPETVLWGPSITDYDDDEPVVGVRCTMIGSL